MTTPFERISLMRSTGSRWSYRGERIRAMITIYNSRDHYARFRGHACCLMLLPSRGGWILGPVFETPNDEHAEVFLNKRLRAAVVKAALLMDPP